MTKFFLMNINILLKLKFPARPQASNNIASEVQQNKVLLNLQLTKVIKYQHHGNREWELFSAKTQALNKFA